MNWDWFNLLALELTLPRILQALADKPVVEVSSRPPRASSLHLYQASKEQQR